jgi:hypothetical protein
MVSDRVTLAYVTKNKALATCREAQLAPETRAYQKAYKAYQSALNAYNVEAELVTTANYARPDMNPLPRFEQ